MQIIINLSDELSAVVCQMKLATGLDEARLMGTAVSLLRIHIQSAQDKKPVVIDKTELIELPFKVEGYPHVC